MKQNKILAIILVVVAVIISYASSNAQTKGYSGLEEARKAIIKSNAIYFDLYAKNDGSVLSLYTDDACLFAPGTPPICGREALAKDFKDTYAAGVVKGGKFTTLTVYGDGNEYVTEEGNWQVFGTGGKLIDEGKFLRLWKKSDNDWKMFRDSFNSNRPQK